MSKKGAPHSVSAVLASIGWPLVAGMALCSLFYAILLRGPWQGQLLTRYFTGHPITYIESALFFVGLAALVFKLGEIIAQWAVLHQPLLQSDVDDAGQMSTDDLLEKLSLLPARLRSSYLGRRLRSALAHVQRRGSTEGLTDELKYLADIDAERQQEGYALVRIVIWATPMLGFLGTVVGITQALGNLNWEEFATSPKTAGEKLGAGLYVAFDTTALALSLSMVLMFVQFMAERLELQLLAGVDDRVEEELEGRLEPAAAPMDPMMAPIQRMCQAVMKTSEQLVQRQVQIWQSTIDAAHQHWQQVVHQSAGQIEVSLSSALDRSLEKFGGYLAEAEKAASEQARERGQQWQTLLSDNARTMHNQQVELARQGEVMLQVVQATGEVVKLEKALNDNLHALAGAKNFEDTVMSLSAAIHLLNARVNHGQEQRDLNLQKNAAQGRAA